MKKLISEFKEFFHRYRQWYDCLQCMEYIGYSNKNCKVIYESDI